MNRREAQDASMMLSWVAPVRYKTVGFNTGLVNSKAVYGVRDEDLGITMVHKHEIQELVESHESRYRAFINEAKSCGYKVMDYTGVKCPRSGGKTDES